jgi:hypothetical protein
MTTKNGTQKHKRVCLIGPAEVKCSSSDLPLKAYILNISYGGIAIQLKEALKGRAEVTIFFADGSGGRIGETAWGHVVWCKASDAFHTAGIEFESLNPKDHALTLRVIQAFAGPLQSPGI